MLHSFPSPNLNLRWQNESSVGVNNRSSAAIDRRHWLSLQETHNKTEVKRSFAFGKHSAWPWKTWKVFIPQNMRCKKYLNAAKFLVNIFALAFSHSRMDLPPSFKPPPPPIKYTTARRVETSANSFPIARCNSITELMLWLFCDTLQQFIYYIHAIYGIVVSGLFYRQNYIKTFSCGQFRCEVTVTGNYKNTCMYVTSTLLCTVSFSCLLVANSKKYLWCLMMIYGKKCT